MKPEEYHDGQVYTRGKALTYKGLTSLPNGALVWAVLWEYDAYARSGKICKHDGLTRIEKTQEPGEWTMPDAGGDFYLDTTDDAALCQDSFDEGYTLLYVAKAKQQ